MNGWTTAAERRARKYEPGNLVRVRGYWRGRIPQWRVGSTGTVIRITRAGSPVVRIEEIDYSCPTECLEPA